MSDFEDKVAVITGAGGGLGKSHALEFASRGAKVVVNDLGGDLHGEATEQTPAMDVVAEIKGLGGEAVANGGSVAEAEGAGEMVQTAIDSFGKIDAVVNVAGILRDSYFHKMTPEQWKAVIDVHLNGTYNVARAAMEHFRAQESGAFVHFTSTSGLVGNTGQANYGAAKAGIASFTIIASKELGRYGVTANAVAPAARTRMTTEGTRERMGTFDEDQFDPYHPDNLGPLVAWLASDQSRAITGRVFNAGGGHIGVSEGWRAGPAVDIDARWKAGELGDVIPQLVSDAVPISDISGEPQS